MSLYIDARMVRASGIGRVIRCLLSTSAFQRRSLTLLGDPVELQNCLNVPPQWRIIHWTPPIYSVGEQLQLPLELCLRNNILWSPHFNAPLLVPQALVCTVHDVIHLRHWRQFGGRLKFAATWCFLRALRSRARCIVFPSEFSCAELHQALSISTAQRAVVIRNGVEHSRFTPAPVDGAPYVLFVGNLKENKNLVSLLQAMPRVFRETGVRLVLVGQTDGFSSSDRAAQEMISSAAEFVSHRGRITDDELIDLFRNTVAVVVPSKYEGFGLTALEGMACGRPVVVADIAPLREIVGDGFDVGTGTGAGVYCDGTPTGIGDAIIGVAKLPMGARAQLQRNARNRALAFDWELSAAALLRVLGAIEHEPPTI